MENDMNYTITRLTDSPYRKAEMSEWFHQKWGIPKEAYDESMEDCLATDGAVPEWYVVVSNDRIIGGAGVIENDFHNRQDLTPNVCALYVEPDARGRGIAGELLDYICSDMSRRGIDVLYLVTDHASFYERYGWTFLCNVRNDGEPYDSRMYVKNAKNELLSNKM